MFRKNQYFGFSKYYTYKKDDKQPNLLDLTSLILTRQSCGCSYLILLSFSQASKDFGTQVLNKSLLAWIDRIGSVFILFSAGIDHYWDKEPRSPPLETSLVHSHWSRNVETRLSLVESFIVLLCQLSYAIKNQLGHPKPPTRGFGTQRPNWSLLAPRWLFMG